MEEPCCKTCLYWMKSPNEEGPNGWCRRFPPSVLYIDAPNNMRNPEMKPDVHSFMPAVHEEIWCGEYKFKGSGKPKAKGKGKGKSKAN